MTKEIKTPWGEIGYITYKRCVEKSTPVLCSDLKWKPAGSLKEGDKILAFDENLIKLKNGEARYIKEAVVTYNNIEKAKCLGIELENGEILYATPDHEWLVKMSSNKLIWRETKDLGKTKYGGPVYLPRIFGEPWETLNTYEAGYLSAAYDGEGHCDNSNGLTFTQVNNEMMDRVEKILTSMGINYIKRLKSKSNSNNQNCYGLRFHGLKNIIRLLGSIDAPRVSRKLKEHLLQPSKKRRGQRMRCNPEDYVKVVRVFDAGEREIAVLSTSEKTHFTAGFPSHNTYARPIKDRTEEFPETVERELRGIEKQLKLYLNDREKDFYRKMRLSLKGSVAGRFMWQLGTKTVDQLGQASLQNCAYVTIDHPVRPFTWAMDMLMLGSGVGYSIERKHISKLPKVKKKVNIVRQDNASADFIVPDSREGWVKLLGKVLKAHFYSGKGFTYSTQLIRSKGAPIKGFGGVASGPEELCAGLGQISEILNARSGQYIRSIDALDIMNIIGSIVVAGNVRRSAQIAIGDMDDQEYLRAKRWDLGPIPNWRAMSNNSVNCPDIEMLPKEFWDTYNQGEPYGLINLALSRKVGRAGETQYPDPDVQGYNPSLRKGTKVWTSEGIKPIEELENTTFNVRNLTGDIEPAECWLSNPNARLYEIQFQGGHKYYCTAEHKWPIFTPQGWVKCETIDLKPGHLMPINKFRELGFGHKGDYSDGFFVGWLYGDGGIHIRKDNGKPQLNLIVSKKDDESQISELLLNKLNSLKENTSSWVERKGNKELSCCASSVFDYLDGFGVDYKCEKLPTSIWFDASEQFRKGFIDALFSSDGHVESTYKSAKIRLSSSKELLIKEVSELLGFYGIKNNTHYTKSRLKDKLFNRYTLDIVSRENISFFKELFSLTVHHKQEKIDEISETDIKPLWGSVYKVEKVTLTDIYEPVWDIKVNDNTHCFQIGHVVTGNCAEQSLANYETCCLAEIYLPNIKSRAELLNVALMLYKINKHSLAIKAHHPETEEIVHKNMRMGIGITGVMMSTEEQLSWLDDTYKKLREFDKEYSAKMGWPESIKLTTLKPSGTLSLLAGVTPGVHPSPAGPKYIRRIRISATSPLVELCRKHGYPIEYLRRFDKTEDHSTVVVSFPCSIPDWVKTGTDIDVIDQLELVKRMQKEWSDNSVSVTAYYDKEDIPRIQEYLKKNWNENFKTLSFMLSMGHGFDQAPYETISEELYQEMITKVTPIGSITISESDISEDQIGCIGGACPIK